MDRIQKQRIIAGWLIFWGLVQAVGFYLMDDLLFAFLGACLALGGVVAYYFEVVDQSVDHHSA